MELGNMIFGNSRGESEIPRTSKWEDPLQELLEACGCDGYGIPGFENEVFCVRSYDWDAECDCGSDERDETWISAHPHEWHCYQTELKERMKRYDVESGYDKIDRAAHGGDERDFLSGFDVEVTTDGPLTAFVATPRSDATHKAWSKAYDARRKFEDKLYDELCQKHGLERPGCAVHCTCYRDKAFAEFSASNPHAPACRLIQPNFLHKPSGFRVNWYKYPLRDSYMTPGVSNKRWRKIMAECVASLSPRS